MDDLEHLARELGAALKARGWMLALAESCTGGLVAEIMTRIPGSSGWVERGLVTYSNTAKMEMLGVLPETLNTFGAVSEQTAREMAQGAINHSHAQVSLSITGIAGPDGGSAEKPVGTVCFAWQIQATPAMSATYHFSGDRLAIRQQSADIALREMLKKIELTSAFPAETNPN
jgi:nicotinamide-nucleotide amidase